MLNSTLLEILRTFDKEQIKKFGMFLISPYHNNNSNVVKLFNSIKKYSPEFINAGLERETLWKTLFPEREFQYGVMKNLIYELQKLTEKFLSFEKYSSSEFEYDMNLLDALLDKKLITLFNKNSKNLKAQLLKSKIDLNYFYNKYILESRELNSLYLNKNSNNKPGNSTGNPNESLLIFFFINFFNSNYNSLHESILYNNPYDNEYMNSVSVFFNISPVKKNNYASMYSSVIETLLNPNDESIFFGLKSLFGKNSGRLGKELKYNVLTALINFCNFQIMKGNTKFIKEQFIIYKMMIDSGNYNNGKDNFINPYMYANIVSMAANLRQFSWAEKFIESFKNKLDISHREQYYLFAMVALNLKRKKFDTALEYFSRLKSGDVIDKITIRRFQLMLYYESGYFDELHSLIDSSKHFISNDYKTSARAKTIFNNFLYFVNKLTEVKGNVKNKKFDRFYFSNLKKQINEREVSNKIWLMEKLDELQMPKIMQRKIKGYS